MARALADPALQASIPDLEFAHAVLVLDCDPIDEAPVLDLRIRKGIRRHNVKLAVASARPTALDAQAASSGRTRRGESCRAGRRATRLLASTRTAERAASATSPPGCATPARTS